MVVPVIKLEIKEPYYIVGHGGLVVRTGDGEQRMTMRTVVGYIEFAIPIEYMRSKLKIWH